MKSLEMLSKIALLAVNTEDFDNQMNNILQIIGKYTKVSRAYIFIDNEEGTATCNEFEWCNQNIEPQIDKLKDLQYSEIPSLRRILLEEGRLYCEDIQTLPQDIINILESQDILSIIIYPLIINNKMKGFIGFDECKTNKQWREKDLTILATISGIISNIYINRFSLIKIKELSSRDALTNIYNRRFILDTLEQDIDRYKEKNHPFSVSIIDIDFFKKINDNYGHQAGDYILQEFTKTILKNIRKTDLLGRYGGEEFIIVTYDSFKINTVKRIEDLLNIIRNKNFIYNNQSINFTFSAGVCDVSDFSLDKISFENIISLADKRLYSAKDAGRDCIKYFE
ncbi:MAG: sensor domain-containing diguanylate cyclase [Sphaerochaetaceae bacterium]|nr:sensor domain-containing diguanylate cyclase [Sphaerochaetaceae bacterium]